MGLWAGSGNSRSTRGSPFTWVNLNRPVNQLESNYIVNKRYITMSQRLRIAACGNTLFGNLLARAAQKEQSGRNFRPGPGTKATALHLYRTSTCILASRGRYHGKVMRERGREGGKDTLPSMSRKVNIKSNCSGGIQSLRLSFKSKANMNDNFLLKGKDLGEETVVTCNFLRRMRTRSDHS